MVVGLGRRETTSLGYNEVCPESFAVNSLQLRGRENRVSHVSSSRLSSRMNGGSCVGFCEFPISRKLMIAFTAVVAVILASSTIVYDRLRVIDAVRNARAHTRELFDTLQQAIDAMVDQETGLRGFLIVGNKKYLELYHGVWRISMLRSRKRKILRRISRAQQKLSQGN